MNQQKVSTSGFLVFNEKVLVIRRQENDSFLAGYYELPGGKVEFGENPDDAIVREFSEETNLKVKMKEIIRLFSYISKDGEKHIVDITYFLELNDDISKLKLSEEHDAYKWVLLDELKDIKMTDEMKMNIKLGFEKYNNTKSI